MFRRCYISFFIINYLIDKQRGYNKKLEILTTKDTFLNFRQLCFHKHRLHLIQNYIVEWEETRT